MRKLLLAVLLVGGCSVASADDGRVERLEKRVAELEGAAKRKAVDVEHRRNELSICLSRARLEYAAYIQANGKRVKGNTWSAADKTWNMAAKNESNAIEACKAEWKD